MASSSQKYERVPGLYFDDGSLIIKAENKEFKVFRSVLADKCAVFRDMAAFPQPPSLSPTGACMEVILHDKAEEMASFLRAIFDLE